MGQEKIMRTFQTNVLTRAPILSFVGVLNSLLSSIRKVCILGLPCREPDSRQCRINWPWALTSCEGLQFVKSTDRYSRWGHVIWKLPSASGRNKAAMTFSIHSISPRIGRKVVDGKWDKMNTHVCVDSAKGWLMRSSHTMDTLTTCERCCRLYSLL